MIKLILQIALLIIFIVLGMAFLLHNDAKVAIDFFVAKTELLTIGVAVTLSFVVGLLVGVLARVPASVMQGFSNRRLKKQVSQKDKEIKKLSGDALTQA